MKKCKYAVSFTLQAPVLSHTSDTISFGLDIATRKYHNKPVLNGTLIRGNILHNLLYFSKCLGNKTDNNLTENDIYKWFGKESENNVAANRSRSNFDYFWQLDDVKIDKDPINHSLDQYNVRYRIGVNEKTGVVESGNLQVIESYFSVGDKPCFTGEICVWVDNDAEAEKFEHWLNKSCQYISSIGALKGVGFGKVLDATIDKLEEDVNEIFKFPESVNCIELEFSLDRPLCVAKPHIPNSNRFVSEDYISGSVLKGAFARQYSFLKTKEDITKSLDFDNLVFTNATPVDVTKKTRPLPIPLSLSVINGEVVDMALQSDYCLLYKEVDASDELECVAPTFSPDWKDSDRELVYKQLNNIDYHCHALISTQRLLTVRTAINNKTGTAADSKLFSLECIDNNIDKKPNNVTPMYWRSEIRLKNIEKNDKQRIAENIAEILVHNGLSDIGKTKANARVNVKRFNCESRHNECSIEPINQLYYIVMLRTEARMLPASYTISPTNGHLQLHQSYENYFNYISKGELTLSHFYSKQRLFGGEFYWKHYRNKNDNYSPEWLSESGSVFVLKAVNNEQDKIKQLLSDWLETGLPVAKDRSDDNWQTDPLVPQNGYGEIVINHRIHSLLSTPKTGELK